jgi:hypothetical protein
MFRPYRAIIRPYYKNRFILHSLPVHFGIQNCLQSWYDVSMLYAIIYIKVKTNIKIEVCLRYCVTRISYMHIVTILTCIGLETLETRANLIVKWKQSLFLNVWRHLYVSLIFTKIYPRICVRWIWRKRPRSNQICEWGRWLNNIAASRWICF